MGHFTDALQKHHSINDNKQREILLGNLLTNETGKIFTIRNYNTFRATCESLVGIGCYSAIITFMYGVFHNSEAYDLQKLKELLEKIKIPGNITLAELCGDFFISVETKRLLRQTGDENYCKKILGSLDPYKRGTEKYFDSNSYSPRDIATFMPAYICKQVLGIDINVEKISQQDIDKIVERIKECYITKHKKEEDYINKINQERAEAENEHKGAKLSRLVPKKKTQFDKNKGVLGILFDLFRAAELSGQKDVFYYIQTQYLWPIMKIVPWKQQNSIEVHLVGTLLGYYMDYIYFWETSRHRNLRRYKFDPSYWGKESRLIYTDKNFLEEMIGNGPNVLSKPAIELGKNNDQLGDLMSEVVYRGKKIIKQTMPNYLYSFLMAFTPYLLYYSGAVKKAITFLIRHYDEINYDDKRKLYVQLTIVKCILSSQKLEEVNILYGYYNYEMDRQEREKKSTMAVLEEIIQYIRDVQDHLKLNQQYTFDTGQAWFDIVFGDGRILKDIKSAENDLVENKIVSEDLFRQLMTYVEALSFPAGIRLSLLDLPNQDNYDKLPGALSDQLIKQGQCFSGKRDEYLAFYQSLRHLNIRQNLNVFIQRHIAKLTDETIQKSIDRIKTLKNIFLESENQTDKDKPDTAPENEIIDPKTEAVLKRIDEIVNELTVKLESQYIGRSEIELSIDRLQRNFIKEYNLPIARDNLIGSLPLAKQNDCNNFLITSEIVYKMLSSRKDVKELDFSPALIPLTKTLELVLNVIFQRMPFVSSDMDGSSRKYYFEKSQKKKSIELGPCINLLKDSFGINVDFNNDKGYLLSWDKKIFFATGTSRFLALKGDTVISFDRLKAFQGLSILIEPGRKQPAISVAFTSDKEHNRMLFIKGLEYVKNNYRNVVAHKDGVSQQTVEECRKILLQTKNLLWILLYIINPYPQE
jgi:hypothetical protein